MKTSKLLLASTAMLAVAASSYAGDLKVGAPAPALKVAKWVKGSPIKTFKPGKVYVVEFWATWCGPCKQSIPHLTEMAKKFKGKVQFTGVDVWEKQGATDNSYFPEVVKFVTDMGAKMDYNVALDGHEGTMAKTWMAAADQNGIPTAFVIDQKGKIAWIGHPMDGLDKVLDGVIAGKFDAAAAAKQREEAEAKQKLVSVAMQNVMTLRGEGKNAEAITALDKVIADNPELANNLQVFKFDMLLKVDETKAYALAKSLGENQFKNDPMTLNQIAWNIAEGKGLKKPDYDVALALAQRASELTQDKDPMILDTLAYVYDKKGNLVKALEIQTKAVDILSKPDSTVAAEFKKEITDRLAEYKKKKAGN